VIPVICAFAWNAYTDSVKQHNALAAELTTAAPIARTWNFGTIVQRLHPHTWKLVMWDRGLRANGGGLLGLALLLGVLARPHDSRLRSYAAAALLFTFVPVAVFTNLFAVHDYYAIEIAAFLLLALAIAVAAWLPLATGSRWMTCGALFFLMASNLWQFWSGDFSRMKGDFNRNIVVLGDAIKQRTPANSSILVYGLEWSAELPYYAERKAFSVPPWFERRDQVWSAPESFLGGVKPSAVVICPGDGIPSPAQVSSLLRSDPTLSGTDVAGCQLLVRGNAEK
jgi:hypothetical protein